MFEQTTTTETQGPRRAKFRRAKDAPGGGSKPMYTWLKDDVIETIIQEEPGYYRVHFVNPNSVAVLIRATEEEINDFWGLETEATPVEEVPTLWSATQNNRP